MSSSKVQSIQTNLSKVDNKIDLFNQHNNIEEIKKKKSIISCYNQHIKRLDKTSYWSKQAFNEIECCNAAK